MALVKKMFKMCTAGINACCRDDAAVAAAAAAAAAA